MVLSLYVCAHGSATSVVSRQIPPPPLLFSDPSADWVAALGSPDGCRVCYDSDGELLTHLTAGFEMELGSSAVTQFCYK